MTKKEECLKALQCLYLEVDATIADDVKRRVLDALDEASKNFVKPVVIGRSELLLDFVSSMHKIKPNWSCQQMLDHINDYEKSSNSQ